MKKSLQIQTSQQSTTMPCRTLIPCFTFTFTSHKTYIAAGDLTFQSPHLEKTTCHETLFQVSSFTGNKIHPPPHFRFTIYSLKTTHHYCTPISHSQPTKSFAPHPTPYQQNQYYQSSPFTKIKKKINEFLLFHY